MKKENSYDKFLERFTLVTSLVGDAVIPGVFRGKINRYFEKADIPRVPYFQFGIITYLLFVLAIIFDILFFQAAFFQNLPIIFKLILSVFVIPIFLIALLFITIVSYKVYLDSKIASNVKKMEEHFPEFLSLLSLNLKAGQPLDEAMSNAARPDFGPLSYEIKEVTKKSKLGSDIGIALKEFTETYDSDVLDETFSLILLAWRKGANTPHLVDRMKENLDVLRNLRRKIIASATSFRIFLSILSVMIAPAMFALAYHLIALIRTLTGQILDISGSAIPFALPVIRLNDGHYTVFAFLSLATISAVTAAIIALVKSGSIKESYKEVLVYAIVSVFSYLIMIELLSGFFAIFIV